MTLQQRETTEFLDLTRGIETVLASAYQRVRFADPRWRGTWEAAALLINPNGPLISGGSDGDNGQTGRKLVMDYYGPRVPIGGGALSGKHGGCKSEQARVIDFQLTSLPPRDRVA